MSSSKANKSKNENKNENICPLRYLNQVFGGKWKTSIICILSADGTPKRYSVIKRRLRNITNVMLAQSLRELEAAGLVSREQYNEMPPRGEYALTERGLNALPFLSEAFKWAVNDMNIENFFCEQCKAIN